MARTFVDRHEIQNFTPDYCKKKRLTQKKMFYTDDQQQFAYFLKHFENCRMLCNNFHHPFRYVLKYWQNEVTLHGWKALLKPTYKKWVKDYNSLAFAFVMQITSYYPEFGYSLRYGVEQNWEHGGSFEMVVHLSCHHGKSNDTSTLTKDIFDGGWMNFRNKPYEIVDNI